MAVALKSKRPLKLKNQFKNDMEIKNKKLNLCKDDSQLTGKNMVVKLKRRTTTRICKDGVKRGGFAAKTWVEWEADFWLRVDRSGDEQSCWTWLGATCPMGNKRGGRYGVASYFGSSKQTRAHRVSFMISRGMDKLPKNREVLHLCNNGLCVRPSHLRLDTHGKNMATAAQDGLIPRGDQSSSRRHPESRPRGEKHPHARLTKTTVLEILRHYYDLQMLQREICKKFKMKSISAIVTGKSWAHIPRPQQYTSADRRRIHRANNGLAHRKATPEKIEQMVAMRKTGKTLREIAEATQISECRIHAWLKRAAKISKPAFE